MLHFLPAPLRGVLVAIAFVSNLLFWAVPVYCVIPIKLVPAASVRRVTTLLLHWLCERWVDGNILLAEGLLRTHWDIRCPKAALRKDVQYLVTANHQTYNDIYVLMRAFDGDIPFFKFFIKQELIWVPILGPVWWALDYPFMKRYSRAQIAANPELANADLETARRACERYRGLPVTVLNFLEGTRYTKAKHDRQESPYRNLLRPKSGGFAFALSAMGSELHTLLDVTIVYPHGAVGFWDFLCGRMKAVVVDIRPREIPAHFITGDYRGDEAFRREFQEWVAGIWREKDALIDQLRNEASGA